MMELDWKPIETAPKDGTEIILGWKDPDDEKMQESFIMKWSDTQTNGLFPGKIGMWVAPDGSLTWNDYKGGGPTHWALLPESEEGGMK